MIRKMLGLIVEAAKVEIAHRKTPLLAPAVETVPAIEAVEVSVTSAVTTPDLRWQSPKFHTDTLASKVCPDCSEEKRIGWYRCQLCTKVAVGARKAAS
jgi:hypothetical protein